MEEEKFDQEPNGENEVQKKNNFFTFKNCCFIAGAVLIVIGIIVLAVIVATQPNL